MPAEHTARTAAPTAAPRRDWRAPAAVVVAYLLAMAATDAFFMADTADYVESITLYERGTEHYFWEFGHLFWRPLGWLWLQVAGPLAQLFVGADLRLKTTLVLVAGNWLAGLGCALLLYGLLRRVCQRTWPAVGVTIGFICAQGLLNYAQAGTAYTPGLACLLAALYLLARAAAATTTAAAAAAAPRAAALAGLCLAGAVCFWVMYLWAVPAVLGAPLLLFGFDRRRVRLCLWAAGACALGTGLCYLGVLLHLHIFSLSGLRAWMSGSAHGNTTRGVARMVFGLARSFVHMGNDGMLFKRFLLHDPHNPVSLWTLVRLSLWKFALFYVFLCALALALLRTAQGRRVLVWLGAGSLPVILFAVFFDGGAIERYLPLYPLVFVAVGYALTQTRAPRPLRFVLLLFLLVLVGGNVLALSRWTLARQQQAAAARVADLQPRLNPASHLVVVTWLDELINFNRSFPFHPLNAQGGLRVDALVTPGTAQVLHWRADFATLTLKAWAAGGDVWLTTRALAPAPQADWNWVEGDDRNVRWAEFPAFCRALELGETAGGADGFRRVLPSAHNVELLRAQPLAAAPSAD